MVVDNVRRTGAAMAARVALPLCLILAWGSSDLRAQPVCNGIGDVSVTGPISGVVGTPCVFTAAATPADATTPITYTWQATGQTAALTHSDSGRADSVELTWTTEGTYVITVTAVNDCGVVTGNPVTIAIKSKPVICNALQSITLEGDSKAAVGANTTITAKCLPADAKSPVTYTWYATGQAKTATETGKGLTDAMSFSWSTLGPQIVTVMALNDCGPAVSGSYAITIENPALPCAPITKIALTCPQTLVAGQPGTFVAAVQPEGATMPVAYTWKGSGVPAPAVHEEGGGTDTAAFTWQEAGKHTVDVSATNACGTPVTAFCELAVVPMVKPCVDLIQVAVSGPTRGVADQSYAFSAVVQPTDTTTPITYMWKVDGQPAITVHGDQDITDTVSLSWPKPGTYAVSVAAMNRCARKVMSQQSITIEARPCEPVRAIMITGPATGAFGENQTFTAIASPESASPPIVYTWEAEGQNRTVTHPDGKAADEVTFTWKAPGRYIVSVTGKNICGADVLAEYVVRITYPRRKSP